MRIFDSEEEQEAAHKVERDRRNHEYWAKRATRSAVTVYIEDFIFGSFLIPTLICIAAIYWVYVDFFGMPPICG